MIRAADPVLTVLLVMSAVWAIACVFEGGIYLLFGHGTSLTRRAGEPTRPRLRGVSFLVLAPTLPLQWITQTQQPHLDLRLVAANVVLFGIGLALWFASRPPRKARAD